MAKVDVSFSVEIPDVEYTEQELKDWLRFELRDNGHLSVENPFANYEVEPIFGTFNYSL